MMLSLILAGLIAALALLFSDILWIMFIGDPNAQYYMEQGDYPRALEYYGKSLDIQLVKLGADHLRVATTYGDMAKVYKSQRDYRQALKYYRMSLDIQLVKLGADHLEVANTYLDLGEVCREQQDYDQALKYFEKCVEIGLPKFSEDYLRQEGVLAIRVGISYNRMADIYHGQGDSVKADEYLKKSLDIYEFYFPKHELTRLTNEKIAIFHVQNGDYPQALEYYGKSLDIQLVKLGADHLDVATTYRTMGLISSAHKDYPQALEYQGKCLEIQLVKLGADHLDVAKTYYDMALSQRHDYPRALEYYGKCLEIQLMKLGADHLDVATTHYQMAVEYEASWKFLDAKEHFRKCLDTRYENLGADHPDTKMVVKRLVPGSSPARAYCDIAESYFDIFRSDTKDVEKGLEYYKKCLDTQLVELGADHLDVATTYAKLGSANRLNFRFIQAMVHYKKCLDIRVEKLGADHPDTEKAQKDVDDVQAMIKIWYKQKEETKMDDS